MEKTRISRSSMREKHFSSFIFTNMSIIYKKSDYLIRFFSKLFNFYLLFKKYFQKRDISSDKATQNTQYN